MLSGVVTLRVFASCKLTQVGGRKPHVQCFGLRDELVGALPKIAALLADGKPIGAQRN